MTAPKRFTILEFVVRFESEHAYFPSYQEIADGLGYSSISGVHRQVQNLAKSGLIERRLYDRRTFELTETGRRALLRKQPCPVCGNPVSH